MILQVEANPWDELSATFSGDTADIPVDAVDNIFLAWPPILSCIEANGRNGHAIDFGCGGGRFAAELAQRGFDVDGIDPSEQMIKNAQVAFGDRVTFRAGSFELPMQPAAVITSIMALQFVEPIESCIAALAATLEPHGLMVFAVHNPEFVAESIRTHRHHTPGVLQIGNVRVPIHIRTAQEYDVIAQAHGLERVFHAEPPFTAEFLERFPVDAPTEFSEYLVLGYRKSGEETT